MNSAVNDFKANVKSAADFISLPATVEGLQESVASIGNTLNSVHPAVEVTQKTVEGHKKPWSYYSDVNWPPWRRLVGAARSFHHLQLHQN